MEGVVKRLEREFVGNKEKIKKMKSRLKKRKSSFNSQYSLNNISINIRYEDP